MTPSVLTHTHTYTHKERVAKRLTMKTNKVTLWVFEQEWDSSPICALTLPDLQGLHQWCKKFVRWLRPACDLGGCNMDSPNRISAQACPHCSGTVVPNLRRGKEEEIEWDDGQGFPVAIVWKNMGHSVISGQNVPSMSCCGHSAFPYTPSTPLSCLIREAPQAIESNSLMICAKACCSLWHAH